MNVTTANLHISLSDALKQRVRERVEEEHFSNPSDYVRALIREDIKRQEEKRLEALILEGLASGPSIAVDSPEMKVFWENLHAEIDAKADSTRT